MKYYGLQRKKHKEDFLYFYAITRTKLLSDLPGKKQDYWKRSYEIISRNKLSPRNNDNSLPANHTCNLNSVIVADLIRREDISKLQNGLKKVLIKYRSSRFFGFHHGGLDEICEEIEHMDSTLSTWHEYINIGAFELNNHPLHSDIDYFSISIYNINSSFLALKFDIHLSEQKMRELNDIIKYNYIDIKGYAHQTLATRSKKGGAIKSYSITQYNEDNLKADKIYEFMSAVEWDFMNAMKKYFPFVLHKKNIIPPRIEVYYTDIDYHEEHRSFWASLGVYDDQGQFIDDRQKIFFENSLSGRYERTQSRNRLLYIVKDDGIEPGQFKSVKDYVYVNLNDYSIEYFRLLFLRLLANEAGMKTIEFKQELDKIKLKKNRLSALLKLKYRFSIAIDDYNRYLRDVDFEMVLAHLGEKYRDNEELLKLIKKPRLISYKNFCNTIQYESNNVERDIKILLKDFDDKKQILQNMADYKNTGRSMIINYIMLIIAAITLFFVIFPDNAVKLANIISRSFSIIKTAIEKIQQYISIKSA